MERNCKKGFTLAEMLIVFLLISIMLAVFAPSMTKSAKKKLDPNCPNGYKTVIAEYTVPGTYTFTVPENIVGTENNVKATIISGGGGGGNAVYNVSSGDLTVGLGGKSGQCMTGTLTLTPSTSEKTSQYALTVGHGGSAGSGGTSSSLGSSGGNGGHGAENTDSSGNPTGVGGVDTDCFGTNVMGAAPGAVCLSGESCNPHGKPGSGFEKNGLSQMGFIAGTGGGGGGFDGATKTPGLGGKGGDGYVRLEYKVTCK